jgi:probable H4MPT-linked C1 transfer pathway protein
MGGVIGLDVGGANTKAVWRDGDERRVVSRPFEVWRDRDGLSAVLREVVTSLGEPEAIALTMTAELSDAFRTKREGVSFVLDAAQAALAGPRLVVLNTVGELLGVEQAREWPFDIAAANWMASALVVAAHFPDALMIDAGGTTVDLIPIAGGDVVVRGRTDLARLMTRELVYTGVARTNLATIARSVPLRGGWCPVASELFAISADVHLILGHIGPDDYACPTPDDRPATIEHARERVARLVCADTEQLSAAEIDAIAAYLHDAQVRLIEQAARDAGTGLTGLAPVVPLGSGAFLAREVAERLGVGVRDLPWSEAERAVAPAAALAELASERLRAGC